LFLAEVAVLPLAVGVRGAYTAEVDVVLVLDLVVGLPLPVREKRGLPLRDRLFLVVISNCTSPLAESLV